MKQKILRYWLAANASAFDAGIHALVAFFGVAGVSQLVPSVTALDLKQLAAVFGVSFIRALINYLAAHPLADFFTAEAPGGAATIPDPSAPAVSNSEPQPPAENTQ